VVKAMKTKVWLKAATVRAIRTMAQTFIATIGSSTVIATVDWRVVVSSTILAGIISVVTSLAGLPEVDKETK
jgi:hypothetical protein